MAEEYFSCKLVLLVFPNIAAYLRDKLILSCKVMHTLRSLVVLLLISAFASAASAHSVNAIDGYLDQAQTQQSLISSQELEGDDPETFSFSDYKAAIYTELLLLPALTDQRTLSNYSDFHPRAPPVNL